MMKTRFAAAGFGLVALAATPVLAGGPVVPAPEPVVTAPVAIVPPAAMFNGAYVGAGVGYAFGGDDRVGIRPPVDGAFTGFDVGDVELSGALANLHAGYRWQQPGSRFVYGVEASVSGGDVNDETSATIDGVEFATESDLKWTAALKGTIGYAIRPDTLLYGFAGYKVGRSDYTIDSAVESLDESRDLDGYVVGAGLERVLNDRWSVRGEYEYTNFGKETLTSENGLFETNDTPEYHTVRVGVNYRF